ncbi:MOSC domain-containing protein YiiM [Phyllobacterium trifolii]|uniref:MOSC domain-containing protein YiiM n=1 Tax=Phyllobacterium trifolii TaxID=300193 RepID=A0A839UIN9_9HYPH|nr:MOSC domain-containing protein [Phyllobacterium trifolii]MBB3148491.1 MOSC domain-containing protein YiiM [Phyllobacterium trifolii]
MARHLNIDGDEQARGIEGHGGEQRAVLVYQLQSYRFWEQFLSRDPMESGQFGENLTVDGILDDDVCIGDRISFWTGAFQRAVRTALPCHRTS